MQSLIPKKFEICKFWKKRAKKKSVREAMKVFKNACTQERARNQEG